MRILCYGDSNTWGYVPNVNGYSKNAIMEQYNEKDCWWYGLKQDNDLFIDALCGRCIAHENRWLKNRNAMQTITQDLANYLNLDLIIVQLGTNDCKSEYGDTPEQITNNLKALLKIITSTTHAQIVIVSPAIIREDTKITQKFYVGAEDKSKKLDRLYKKLAQENNCIFISGADLEVGEDGEHLTKLGHKQLAQKVLNEVELIKYNKTFTNEL